MSKPSKPVTDIQQIVRLNIEAKELRQALFHSNRALQQADILLAQIKLDIETLDLRGILDNNLHHLDLCFATIVKDKKAN